MRSTKIVATLGPATDVLPSLSVLIRAGVDVFRLNASHGKWEDHQRRIAAVRSASSETGVACGILLDLQGPKIRLGKFAGGRAELTTGSEFTITTESVLGDSHRASTGYASFAQEVKPGDTILLADGSVTLRALSTDGESVLTEVVSGGAIGDNKGINLPGSVLSTPSLTEKDRADLTNGLNAGIDCVALSFVRTGDDMLVLARCLDDAHIRLPMIAKIEKPEGWKNLEAILNVSDGVMVARGDLGVEMPLENVPFIQKSIIDAARKHGKFVITATQMLESMIEHPSPTRAEVSDVANAICDGTDAVMLSAETSVGHNAAAAVETMARIAGETERWMSPKGYREPISLRDPSNAEIVADAAYHAARAASVAAVVVYTMSGGTARLISRFRPPVPIFAFTTRESVARQLQLCFGVHPIIAHEVDSTEKMLAQMERMLVDSGCLRPGDNVVFVAGQPIGQIGSANLIKLHRIGSGG